MRQPYAKTLIGCVESITLGLNDLSGQFSHLPLKVRIDSGASTSSLHARDIKLFQKDGKTYARFFINFGGWWVETEAPIVREGIVRTSLGQEDSRIFIRCSVRAGDRELKVHFSLSDRSKMMYPALLGRNFLSRGYLVDVTKKYLLNLPVGQLSHLSLVVPQQKV